MKINLFTQWVLFSLVLCFGLYGCGQTGALYLPTETHEDGDD